LAELIEVGFKKSGTGKKFAVYGLSCDSFYIGINPSGKLEWDGIIYIANHVVFSKWMSGEWKDLDVQWGFQDYEKWIIIQRDPAFDFTLYFDYIKIGDFRFTATVNFFSTEYYELRWHIDTDGFIYFDTNWDPFSTISFEFLHEPSTNKVEIIASGLRAENWSVAWDLWPPEDWDLEFEGQLQIVDIDIYVTINGERHRLPF